MSDFDVWRASREAGEADHLTAKEQSRLACVCGHRLIRHTEYGCIDCGTSEASTPQHNFQRTSAILAAAEERIQEPGTSGEFGRLVWPAPAPDPGAGLREAAQAVVQYGEDVDSGSVLWSGTEWRRLWQAIRAALPARSDAGLRTALYKAIGSLTDERVDQLMRQAAIPLHGRPISVDLQVREVAALIRSSLKESVDTALAAADHENDHAE